MALLTKICGLNDEAGIEAAVENGADMLGFVFFDKSPRHLGPERAEELLKLVPSGVDRVGLFVDPENDYLDRVLAKARLDLLQLHGDESPERCRAISVFFGLPIIKAIKVSTPKDVAKARDYAGAVDWLLFDAKAPADASRPGGNGKPFDWSMLKGKSFDRPWLLSGGLTAENLPEAVKQSGAVAVDVSSGVESAPGKKDPLRIATFLQVAKRLG